MSKWTCTHDRVETLRAINTDAPGSPPKGKEEPAWCRFCGALWCEIPFGTGWGWAYPMNDSEAPTLFNILNDKKEE